MASKAGVTLDTIVIEIESSAEKANTNIANLTKTLTELKSAVKGGFNNLSKLAESLNSLNKASANIDTTVKNLAGLQQITSALSELSKIEKPTGMANAIKNIEKIPEAFGKIDTSTLENVSRVSQTLATSLSPLASKLADIGHGYSAINQLADRYGVSTTKIREYTKQAKDHTEGFRRALSNLGGIFKRVTTSSQDFSKNAIRGFGKLHSKIKQVGLSLLGTRSLFTAVRKAVSEYMAMDQELTNTTQNLWRALGAQLAPVIEQILYLFKQAIRVVYSFVKALTGIDLIARANAKATASWGKAAKDTLGNLQKFDDLNTVDFGKGAGDDNKLIELEEINLSPIKKILELVKKIKKEMQAAFNTGQWEGVGKAIADLLNYGFANVQTANIVIAIEKFTRPIVDTVNGIMRNLDWGGFGSALGNIYSSIITVIGNAINNLDFSAFGNGLANAILGFDLSSVLDAWSTVFSGLNNAITNFVTSVNEKWKELREEASEVGKSLATIFNNATTEIDWVGLTKFCIEGINTLIDAAFSFITTFDWSQLGNMLGDIVNTAFNTFDFEKAAGAITGFISGILDTLTSLLKKIDWYNVGEKIIKLIIDVDWARLAVDLLEFMESLWGGMLDAAAGVGASIGDFLSSLFLGGTKIEDDSRTFGEKIGDAVTQGALERTKFKMEHRGMDGGFGVISYIKGLIKGWFGIHSPSKWAKDEIGDNIATGFANGLSGMWDKSKKHFTTFVNGVIEIINKMINKINSKLRISIGSTLSSILQTLGVKVNGGTYQLFSIPTIPKLETGTNEIPYEGLYHLHPGEAVVPKKYNPAIGGGNSEETNQKLDTLISIMNSMEFTNVVNIGNKTIYKEQQKYNSFQNDKYGTTVNT